MTSSESPSESPSDSPVFPDEADAVEQTRPAAAPLESDESDWQEQQKVVDGFDEDDFR